eukprot:CAMPEP_0115006964 /NCGR_PEP_ID=MMETSP0216-20121206/20844_1 /TAXON_ID=223996 /ORGANISM="Protocruzia adherens, Strain Boccale" /LENGTH=401 /DNA_ID=CAMNT_0002373709 /DNA_START=69 /DNA_END=1271 /DNA_ORIENTATION=+
MKSANIQTSQVVLVCLGLFLVSSYGLDDGMWPTPLMGWNSYNSFKHALNETTARETADLLVSLGLRDLKYQYLIIDDGWQAAERDSDGNLQADVAKFPNGIPSLVDYVHSKGLKIGLYSDAGYRACLQDVPGSLGQELKDMTLLAKWKVDYLKYDNCFPADRKHLYNFNYLDSIINFPVFVQTPPERERFGAMGDTLKKLKPEWPITFELCLYGFDHVEEWGPTTGHHWRINTDPKDNWFSLVWNFDTTDEDRLALNQGPTLGWNYVGEMFTVCGGMSDIEYKTAFGWHAIVKTPLVLGTDLRTIKKGDYGHSLMTNPGVIAISQDPLGKQARCVFQCSRGFTSPFHKNFWASVQIWQGPLSNDSWIIMVVNRYFHSQAFEFDWEEDAQIPIGTYELYDVW